MTNKIEKVLTFEEFYLYYQNNGELYKHVQRRKEAMEIAWNSRNNEIEQLNERIRELEKTISSSLTPESSP